MTDTNPGPTMPWRAKNAIEQWMGAVELQHERANAPFAAAIAGVSLGESVSAVALERDVNIRTVDIELYMVALRRFRRAAELCIRYIPGGKALNNATKEFDKRVPHAITLRDVTEHFDDYQIGKGFARQPGEVGFQTSYRLGNFVEGSQVGGASFSWGHRSVNSTEATAAARRLYASVKAFLTPLL